MMSHRTSAAVRASRRARTASTKPADRGALTG
jgi:hypothetical protein